MASNLSFAVQETVSDFPFQSLVEAYRPLLEEQGFHSIETDPQSRAMSSRGLRISLGQNDKRHLGAWLSQGSALTNLTLEDEQPITEEEGRPTPHVGMNPTFPKQTTSLNTILMSSGCRWTMHLDDVIQVCRDVAIQLAYLHAASTVYGDLRVDSIHINDQGRAFLISPAKSKELKNNPLLLEECARDVKALCMVIGGMYRFYFRNKLPASRNSNQKAETAFSDLLKRGYRDSLSAQDLLEELERILLTDEVGEPVEASNQIPNSGAVDVKGAESVPELGAVNTNAPQPESEALVLPGLGPGAIGNQGPEIGSEAVSYQAPELGSGASANQGPGNEPGDGSSEHLELLSGEAGDNNLDRECLSDQASTHDQLMSGTIF